MADRNQQYNSTYLPLLHKKLRESVGRVRGTKFIGWNPELQQFELMEAPSAQSSGGLPTPAQTGSLLYSNGSQFVESYDASNLGIRALPFDAAGSRILINDVCAGEGIYGVDFCSHGIAANGNIQIRSTFGFVAVRGAIAAGAWIEGGFVGIGTSAANVLRFFATTGGATRQNVAGFTAIPVTVSPGYVQAEFQALRNYVVNLGNALAAYNEIGNL